MAKTKQNKTKQTAENETKLSAPVSTRGRTFEGYVIKKFTKRVVVEFERNVYVQKYERFFKRKTRIHARLPESIDVQIGDYIQVRETRPLSKIIHFIVLKIIRTSQEAKQ